MRIRAIAVFEGLIYNCYVVDADRPDRLVLEVDALLRPGDADDGPLLLPVPTYLALTGDRATSRSMLGQLSARGRVVERDGVSHIAFPTWQFVEG